MHLGTPLWVYLVKTLRMFLHCRDLQFILTYTQVWEPLLLHNAYWRKAMMICLMRIYRQVLKYNTYTDIIPAYLPLPLKIRCCFFFLLSGLRNGREAWMKLAFIQCLVHTQICPKAFHFKIFVHVCAQSPSYVQIFVTAWTVACQTPLFMNFLGKNIGGACHFLLQGIFLTQGLNLHLLRLLHCQGDSLSLHQNPYRSININFTLRPWTWAISTCPNDRASTFLFWGQNWKARRSQIGNINE